MWYQLKSYNNFVFMSTLVFPSSFILFNKLFDAFHKKIYQEVNEKR